MYEKLTEIFANTKGIKPKKIEIHSNNRVNEVSFVGKKTITQDEVLIIISKYLHTHVSKIYKETFDQTVTFF